MTKIYLILLLKSFFGKTPAPTNYILLPLGQLRRLNSWTQTDDGVVIFAPRHIRAYTLVWNLVGVG